MNIPLDSNLILNELNSIMQAIDADTKHLQILHQRKGELWAYLDKETKPPEPQKLTTTTTERFRGVIFKGVRVYKWTCIETYLEVLRRLWIELPNKRLAMAQAAANRGTNRRYLHQRREMLFSEKSAEWTKKHSKEFLPGWYVDTNLNLERMHCVLQAVIRAAGLHWNSDVKLYWRNVTLPTQHRIEGNGGGATLH